MPYGWDKMTAAKLLGGLALTGSTPSISFGRRTRGKQRYRGAASQTEQETRRKRIKGRSSTFKDRMLKQVEAKHYTNNNLTTMTHQTLYAMCPTSLITQGTSISTRVGDKIHLSALKFKASYQAPTTSGAFAFRIIIGYSGEEITPSSSFAAAALADAEVFQPSTSPNWSSNGLINPKAFTMIYDERIDLNSMTTDTAEQRSISASVQLDKDFPYQAPASVQGKFRNLYVVITSNIVGGTAGTTGSGGFVFAWDLIFKDL